MLTPVILPPEPSEPVMPAKLLPNQTALIDNIRDLVRTGYGALVTFQAPDAPWLEIAGPNGVQPGGHLFGASVPTVRLRRNGDAAPLAEAAANNDFSGGLSRLAECAKPLVGDEFPALLALLAAVHEASGAKRRRVQKVSGRVADTGEPPRARADTPARRSGSITAATPRRGPTPDLLVAQVSSLVRDGYGGLLTFEKSRAWLEVAGPRGIRGGDGAFGLAPVTTLRLCQLDATAPLAEAAVDGAFVSGLDAIADKARELAGEEFGQLVAVLNAVRRLCAKPRTRMPTVGLGVVEHGVPNLDAWLSCLTLADLERTLVESSEDLAAA